MPDQHRILLSQSILLLLLSVMGIPVISALNAFLFLAYRRIVTLARPCDSPPIAARDAALRVATTGAYWQALLFLTLAIASNVDSYFGYAQWFMTLADVLMLVIGTARLAVVFRLVRRESGGSGVAGLLAAVLSLDVWYVFCVIYDYRFP